jgi:hypothetical protein
VVFGGALWFGLSLKEPMLTLAAITGACGGIAGLFLSTPLSVHPYNASLIGAGLAMMATLISLILYREVRSKKRR